MAHRLRIWIITFAPSRGGTEKAAIDLALAVHKMGHEVKVFFTDSDSGPRRTTLLENKIPNTFLTDEAMAQTQTMSASERPNVINYHLLSDDRCIVYRLRKFIPKAVFIETNVFPDVKNMSHLADTSIQLSHWCALRYFANSVGIRRPHVAVIPNPVRSDCFYRSDDEQRALWRRQNGIPTDGFVIARIGQQIEGKWHPGLVDVFGRCPKNCVLVLVGAPPSVIIEAESAPIETKSRIRVLSHIDNESELRTFYSSVDVLAHWARIGETFGYVIAESLLCGTPVVTMFVSGLDNTQAELVRHGKNGFVACTEGEFEEWVSVLAWDSILLGKMRTRCRASVTSRYSDRKVARQFVNLCERRFPHRRWTGPFLSFLAVVVQYVALGRRSVLILREALRLWLHAVRLPRLRRQFARAVRFLQRFAPFS